MTAAPPRPPVRVLVVLSFDLPEVEDIMEILKTIDPQKLPHFAGEVRIVVPPIAQHLEEWLDA